MKPIARHRGASILMILLILALAAVGMYFFVKSLREAREIEREMQTPPPAPAPGTESAPPLPPPEAARRGAAQVEEPSWTLKGLDGRAVRLSDFKGKVVVLTFWATWCGYCKMQMPSLQKLYESEGGDRIVFLMVSTEAERPVREFLSRNSYTMPFYLSPGNIPSMFRTQGVPATFILDKTGAVARKEVGARDWFSDEIRRYLKTLA